MSAWRSRRRWLKGTEAQPGAACCCVPPATDPPPSTPPPSAQLAVKTGIPEGTSGQICNEIALNPVFQPQLDTAIVSGKKTLQR